MEPNVLLEHQKKLANTAVTVPGKIIENIFIPARGYLRARIVKKGYVLRIIDLEGQQVPDIIFYDAHNLKDVSSCCFTRSICGRWKIGKGDTVYSKYCKPMAEIVEDTAGLHYFGGGCCTDELNFIRYGAEGTHNCRSNFGASLALFGINQEDIEMDSILNFFMDLQFDPDGSYIIRPCPSKKGDYVDLLTEMDILVSISNCPQELNACNGWNPTSLRAVIYDPASNPKNI